MLLEKGLWPARSPICGTCSTTLMLRYFSDRTPFENVDLALKRDSEGLISFGEISRYLTGRGLRVGGIRGGVGDIMKSDVGYILAMRSEGEAFHFVFALYDSKGNCWQIADPQTNTEFVEVPEGALEKEWSGMALIVSRS